MAVTLKVLFFNDLSSSPSGSGGVTTVLDTGATRAWLIRNIYFYNPNGSVITIDILVKGSGTTNTLFSGYSVAANDEFLFDHEIALNHPTTNDSISVICKNASSLPLSCIVCGIERDQ